MSDVPSEHPLGVALARLSALDPDQGYLLAGAGGGGRGAGWTSCAELVRDPSLLRLWQQEVAAHLHAEHGRRVASVVPAAWVLGWYAGVLGVGAALFSLSRRVPALDPGSLAFQRHPEGRWPHVVAVLAPRFWCLPDDPAAGHPDAVVVPDEEALAGVLRRQVRDHADAFLAVHDPGVRLPRRSLLGAFVDAVDEAPWTVGTGTGDPERGRRDSLLVLPGATPELPGASRLFHLTDDRGREHLTRERVACCYEYRVPPGTTCFTCPRTSNAERASRAAAW